MANTIPSHTAPDHYTAVLKCGCNKSWIVCLRNVRSYVQFSIRYMSTIFLSSLHTSRPSICLLSSPYDLLICRFRLDLPNNTDSFNRRRTVLTPMLVSIDSYFAGNLPSSQKWDFCDHLNTLLTHWKSSSSDSSWMMPTELKLLLSWYNAAYLMDFRSSQPFVFTSRVLKNYNHSQ